MSLCPFSLSSVSLTGNSLDVPREREGEEAKGRELEVRCVGEDGREGEEEDGGGKDSGGERGNALRYLLISMEINIFFGSPIKCASSRGLEVVCSYETQMINGAEWKRTRSIYRK